MNWKLLAALVVLVQIFSSATTSSSSFSASSKRSSLPSRTFYPISEEEEDLVQNGMGVQDGDDDGEGGDDDDVDLKYEQGPNFYHDGLEGDDRGFYSPGDSFEWNDEDREDLPAVNKRLTFSPNEYVKRRLCIPPTMSCNLRPNYCCNNTTCRCNLWGQNCRCLRMGLFQRWGRKK